MTKRINLAVESNDANAIKLATAESNSINVLVSATLRMVSCQMILLSFLESGDAQKIIDVALNVRASQFELDISSLLEARTAEKSHCRLVILSKFKRLWNRSQHSKILRSPRYWKAVRRLLQSPERPCSCPKCCLQRAS